VTGLRGRAGIAGAALTMVAGLAIPAATATTATAAATPTQGIDVSSLQHPTTTSTINWGNVAAAGKAFVAIKASEGKYYTNDYYAGNPSKGEESDVLQATAAGMYVIPYAFANPFPSSQDGTAQQQADTAAGVVKSVTPPADLMLPLALDLEADPYAAQDDTNQCYGLSPTAMVTWINSFIGEYDKDLPETRPLIIYTAADWWDTCTGSNATFGGHPLWLASYGVSNPALPAGWSNYTFWQYADNGTVSGITGPVDLNYLGPVLQVSQLRKSVGTVQLNTLTSLVGHTAVTYPAEPVLPGLTLNSSGQITGTPTTPGRYSVTVTPSTGVPSAISFTWDVHGTLTVSSPGNQTTTAGTPVWLHVTDTDPDGSSFPPSLAVSGLPPGVSINSAGVISGWPFRPGTYTVTFSASDALYASASAAFTWTVKAAPDSGGTGTIRQWGGSGKCLNDANSSTANGAAVNLWSCTGKSNQSWTMAQDGTIRVLGKCLDAVGAGTANGTTLQLWTCNSGDGRQQWLAGTDSQLVNPQSGKCLNVPSANAANGTRPELWTCANSTSQASEHWLRPAASVYSGDAGKCLGLSGSTVVLAGCANLNSQHWTQKWDGTFRLGAGCLTQTGSGLSIGSCSGAAATKWQLRSVGTLPIATEIVNAGTGTCVTAPSPFNGTKLILSTCAANDAETWHVE
jgi:GH25 family lysozyme M1 (1,4-beta-N-acetylmuramidase)